MQLLPTELRVLIATVILFDGNKSTQLLTNENGVLIVGFPKNKKVVITFKKEGFISKKIEIDTKANGKKNNPLYLRFSS